MNEELASPMDDEIMMENLARVKNCFKKGGMRAWILRPGASAQSSLQISHPSPKDQLSFYIRSKQSL
ncbi:hypothetical protein A2U01_0106352 [Trifolium medium]|uniref:Uncharacterized protein n=1 Tax=Trifolium medium TaxID=97028 RepID=A0A392VCC6_9FABA|nr:hypothetical protein [Trifolium medium]